MHSRQLALFVAAAGLLSGGRPPLRVLRTTPDATASPATTITVVFDRPVAGSLDYTIDPRTIVHVDPDIPGKLEWRDPITIQLTPAHPLTSGASYTVVIDPGFHAMDGSRLAEPYRFTFRTLGPTLVWGTPANPDSDGRFVEPTSAFELVWSTPPDPALIVQTERLVFDSRDAARRPPAHVPNRRRSLSSAQLRGRRHRRHALRCISSRRVMAMPMRFRRVLTCATRR